MSAAAYGEDDGLNGEPVTENNCSNPGYTHYDKRNLYADATT